MGTRFLEILRIMNLTNAKFGKLVGVTEGAIRNITSGRVSTISPEIIDYLASYEINIDWLLTGRGEMFLDTTKKTSGIYLSDVKNVNINSNNNSHHSLLDDDEYEIISAIRKNKKNKSKLIAAIHSLLKLGLILLAVYKTVEYII